MIGAAARASDIRKPPYRPADLEIAAGASFRSVDRRRICAAWRPRRNRASMNRRASNGSLPAWRHGAAKRMNGRLTGLSSMATRHILADLARDYEAGQGVSVEIRSMGGVEAAKLVRAGEATDIVVLASKVMGAWRRKAISSKAAQGTSRGRRSALRSARARRCLASSANKRSGRPCSMRGEFATRPVRAAIT